MELLNQDQNIHALSDNEVIIYARSKLDNNYFSISKFSTNIIAQYNSVLKTNIDDIQWADIVTVIKNLKFDVDYNKDKYSVKDIITLNETEEIPLIFRQFYKTHLMLIDPLIARYCKIVDSAMLNSQASFLYDENKICRLKYNFYINFTSKQIEQLKKLCKFKNLSKDDTTMNQLFEVFNIELINNETDDTKLLDVTFNEFLNMNSTKRTILLYKKISEDNLILLVDTMSHLDNSNMILFLDHLYGVKELFHLESTVIYFFHIICKYCIDHGIVFNFQNLHDTIKSIKTVKDWKTFFELIKFNDKHTNYVDELTQNKITIECVKSHIIQSLINVFNDHFVDNRYYKAKKILPQSMFINEHINFILVMIDLTDHYGDLLLSILPDLILDKYIP